MGLELHNAVEADDVKKVTEILETSDSVEHVDVDGCTSLHIACAGGNLTIIQKLLMKGANINARSNIGHTPLHLACRYGHVSTVLALLFKGSELDLKDIEGNTALHKAASNNHAMICKELVRRGSDLSLGNKNKFTALHWAAFKGHFKTTTALLDIGADHSLKTSKGTTPLHAACYYAHTNVVKALLKAGADPSIADSQGVKPGDDFNDKVSVALRFEVKKLIRQRYALMSEGHLELRDMYVTAWKELETKSMAVTKSAIEADLLWDRLARKDHELNMSKIGTRDLTEAVNQIKVSLEEHRRALKVKTARIAELETENKLLRKGISVGRGNLSFSCDVSPQNN